MRRGPLTVIDWVDSSGPVGRNWYDAHTVGQVAPAQCASAGWLVREDRRSVTIAAHSDGDENFGGVLCIPKTAIVKRTTLRKGQR